MAQTTDEAAQQLKDQRWRQMMEALSAMRVEEKGDVIIVCGNRDFYAHKWVLLSSSSYFDRMFDTELDVINSGRIVLNDIEPETLDAILDFIYLGDVLKIQTEEQLIKVLAASHLLQLEQLAEYCSASLAKMLSVSTFFGLAEVARKCNQKELDEKLSTFWISNASKLVVTKKFLSLPVEDVKKHIRTMTRNRCCLDVMVRGMLSWVCFDLKAREIFVGDLFACIEATLVTTNCVDSLLKNEIIVNASDEIAEKITELANEVYSISKSNVKACASDITTVAVESAVTKDCVDHSKLAESIPESPKNMPTTKADIPLESKVILNPAGYRFPGENGLSSEYESSLKYELPSEHRSPTDPESLNVYDSPSQHKTSPKYDPSIETKLNNKIYDAKSGDTNTISTPISTEPVVEALQPVQFDNISKSTDGIPPTKSIISDTSRTAFAKNNIESDEVSKQNAILQKTDDSGSTVEYISHEAATAIQINTAMLVESRFVTRPISYGSTGKSVETSPIARREPSPKLHSSDKHASASESKDIAESIDTITSSDDTLNRTVIVNDETVIMRKPISQALGQSVRLPMTSSWARKLTYFSRYRIVDITDPSGSGFKMSRTEEVKCIQQFDLASMSWLSLQIPELGPSGYLWSYIPMCQYGRYIHMIGDRNNWGVHGIFDIESSIFIPSYSPKFSKGLGTKMCSFQNQLYAVGGYRNNEVTNSVHHAEPGKESWYEGRALNYGQLNPMLLASSDYMYVIGDIPRVKDEILLEYNAAPNRGHEWEVIRTLRRGLAANRFFIFNNLLHALYFGEAEPKLLVFNHATKQLEIERSFFFPDDLKEPIELSSFQNPQSPFVFFSRRDDYFSIPIYLWEPENGQWTKLPVQTGKCGIPNHQSVRFVYSVEKWDE